MTKIKPNDNYSDEEIYELLRLRLWQHQINEKLKSGGFGKPIPIHLAIGHEAIALGIAKTKGSSDAICLTHRNCAFNLACSQSLRKELEFYKLNDKTRKAQMGPFRAK